MRDAALVAVLRDAQVRGLVGPSPVERHVEHADGLAQLAEAALGAPPRRALDLGSGGGVPGLVLASRWPGSALVLLDSMRRRTSFLRQAVAELGLDGVEVMEGRAETLAHDEHLRERFDLVTARSFGPPAVTAECATGFVALGKVVVVADPPVGDGTPGRRWDAEGLATLGLERVRSVDAPVSATVLVKTAPAAARWPRRAGLPAKRPLW